MIRTQFARMHCQKCDHLWNAEMLVGVAISVFVAHIESIHCPQCYAGFKQLSFVTDEEKFREAQKSNASKTEESTDKAGADV